MKPSDCFWCGKEPCECKPAGRYPDTSEPCPWTDDEENPWRPGGKPCRLRHGHIGPHETT